MSSLGNILIRVILSLTLLFLSTRILTKRSIANLTYFDYVATATLGTIAGNLAFNVRVKIHVFVVAMILITLIIYIISYVSLKINPFRKFLTGEPTFLIREGKILEHNMASLNYSYDYLIQQLRQEKVFDIGQVQYAILEPNGKLSIELKPENKPVTAKDLNISNNGGGFAREIILEGKVIDKNLKDLGYDIAWLQNELTKRGIDKIEEISFSALSTNGKIYIDLYKDE